jgi:hypothetical protein
MRFTTQRAAGLSAWGACFALALLLAPGFSTFETPDKHALLAFVETGSFALDELPAGGPYAIGVDGRPYSAHEIGADLAALPAAWAAHALSARVNIPFVRLLELLLVPLAAACFATTVVVLASLGATMGLPFRSGAAAIAALSLSSQYLLYVGTMPDVSLAAPILAIGLTCWTRAEGGQLRAWLFAGLCAGLLLAIKLCLGTIGFVLVVLAVTARADGLSDRARRVMCAGLGMLPGVLIALWWNVVRTGSPLATLYPHEIVAIHPAAVLPGIIGTLASPGKGLFVFSPVLLLLPFAFVRGGAGRVHGRMAFLILGSMFLSMLTLAGTINWTSFGGWGVRYYVPWIPPLLLWLAVSGRRRGRRMRYALAGLAAAGLLINGSALVTNFHYRQQLCGYQPWTLHGANVCSVAALPDNLRRLAGANVPEVRVPEASAVNVWASNRLALWWYAARYAGLPRAASWTIAMALLFSAAAGWRRLWLARP